MASTGFTSDQIMRGIYLAIQERDFEAVVTLIGMLALVHPEQAQLVYDSILAVTSAAEGEQ